MPQRSHCSTGTPSTFVLWRQTRRWCLTSSLQGTTKALWECDHYLIKSLRVSPSRCWVTLSRTKPSELSLQSNPIDLVPDWRWCHSQCFLLRNAYKCEETNHVVICWYVCSNMRHTHWHSVSEVSVFLWFTPFCEGCKWGGSVNISEAAHVTASLMC